MALFLYERDAIKRCPKEVVVKEAGKTFADIPWIRFDLEHIDIVEKGWTRYYPFSIDGKQFIIRIFLTEEKYLQPKVETLLNGSIEKPPVTFEILPALSSVLKSCRIKPYNPTPPKEVDTSI
jgi:hypothetical protein